jgi:hypothetical protein
MFQLESLFSKIWKELQNITQLITNNYRLTVHHYKDVISSITHCMDQNPSCENDSYTASQ